MFSSYYTFISEVIVPYSFFVIIRHFKIVLSQLQRQSRDITSTQNPSYFWSLQYQIISGIVISI